MSTIRGRVLLVKRILYFSSDLFSSNVLKLFVVCQIICQIVFLISNEIMMTAGRIEKLRYIALLITTLGVKSRLLSVIQSGSSESILKGKIEKLRSALEGPSSGPSNSFLCCTRLRPGRAERIDRYVA